eukprot:3538857-Rhodomonas_salina.3
MLCQYRTSHSALVGSEQNTLWQYWNKRGKKRKLYQELGAVFSCGGVREREMRQRRSPRQYCRIAPYAGSVPHSA